MRVRGPHVVILSASKTQFFRATRQLNQDPVAHAPTASGGLLLIWGSRAGDGQIPAAKLCYNAMALSLHEGLTSFTQVLQDKYPGPSPTNFQKEKGLYS